MKNYEWFGLCPISHGHYKFSTFKRGNLHTLVITDMEVVDLIKNRDRGWKTAIKRLKTRAVPVYKTIN